MGHEHNFDIRKTDGFYCHCGVLMSDYIEKTTAASIERGIGMNAAKLNERGLALEEMQKADQTLEFLRHSMGQYAFDRCDAARFVEGYKEAMERIVRQSEL